MICSSYIIHRENSCKQITINSTTDNINVTFYHFNSEVNIITPSGYVPDQGQLNCNPNNAYFSVFGDTYSSIQTSADAIFGGNLPCSSTTFYCTDVSASCIMTNDYVSLESPFVSPIESFQPYMQCYGPFYIDSITNMRCTGSCPSSPTSPPSFSPTGSPTESTEIPTATPTVAPTTSPSGAPVAEPTTSPSSSPTSEPSSEPTTAKPSANPTESPSPSPSVDPTVEPTEAPTPSPSRQPTITEAYDSYIPVIYGLAQLTNENIIRIAHNATTVMRYTEDIIEYGYNSDINLIVEYSDFWVQIFEICTKRECYAIPDINDGLQIVLSNSKEFLTLNAKIKCRSAICDHMVEKYDKAAFQKVCTAKLRKYFDKDLNNYFNVNADNRDQLKFTVVSGMEEYLLLNPPSTEEAETLSALMIAVFTFMGIMFLLSFMAWLHNQGRLCCIFPASTPVDNAAWMACAVFSVQVWDFVSDVNLSIEILTIHQLDNPLILLAGMGSLTFTILPYLGNLVIAGRIKRIIRNNDAARAWFTDYSTLFVLLVVCSGGAHPALALVSSNVFGLWFLNSGLTLYELRQLQKIKIIGTILLENVPQLFCQILYISATGISFATPWISILET